MSKEKLFLCECGKEFTNSQSFNGHKSRCKTHHLNKYGNLDILNRVSLAAAEGHKKLKEHNYDNSWVLEEHHCEKCGKLLVTKFASGRFCNSSCAHSHIQTASQNKSRSDKLTKRKDDKYCKLCGKKLNYRNSSGYCVSCIKICDERSGIRSEISKKGFMTRLKSGKFKGWNSRNIISFPEQFFIKVLDNNGILYEHNKPVKRCSGLNYFLDFYINTPGAKIDLEIDGKQHRTKEAQEYDLHRTEELENLGYTVYRIDWNEVNSEKGKQEMKTKIDNFLIFYRNMTKE